MRYLLFLLLVLACFFSYAQQVPVTIIRNPLSGKPAMWDQGGAFKQQSIIIYADDDGNRYYVDCGGTDCILKMLPATAKIKDNNCDYRPKRLFAIGNESATLTASILGIPACYCNIDHFDSVTYQIFAHPASEVALKIRNNICATEHIQSKNFEVRSAMVQSATAVLDSNKRYILYNESYLARMTRHNNIKAPAYFVFAHEIAHFLNWNMYEQGDLTTRRTDELAADEWAGRALGDMGISRGNTLKWLRQHHAGDDPLYPAKRERKNAIIVGWQSSNPRMNVYRFSVGGSLAFRSGGFDNTRSFNTDASKLLSLDAFYHPQISNFLLLNKTLSHIAIGMSYLPYYNVLFQTNNTYIDDPWGPVQQDGSFESSGTSAIDLSKFLITVRFYAGNYYKKNSNFAVSYSFGTRITQLKLALTHSFFSKRIDLEAYVAPSTFKFDEQQEFRTYKLLFGIAAYGSFSNYNHR